MEENRQDDSRRLRMLDAVVEGVADPVFVKDLEGRYLFLNRAGCELLGLERESVLGRTDPEIFGEGPGRKVQAEDREILGDEATRTFEVVRELPTGARTMLFTKGVFRSSDGSPLGIFGIARDLTPQLVVEKAREESEARLRLFFEAAFEGIAITEKGVVVDCNPRMAELLGFSRDGLVGTHVLDIVADEDRERVQERMRAGDDGVYRHRAKRKDGTTLPVEVQGRRLPMAERSVRVTAIRDLTERERFSEWLTVLTKAVESSGEVVFLTDRQGLFTYVNPAFTELYGWRSEEVVGKTTPRTLKSGLYGEDHYAGMWSTLVSGEVFEGELKNRKKSGELVDIKASANPILDDHGEIVGFLAIQSDITARKRHEETLLAIARGVSGSTGEGFFRDLVHHLSRAVGADMALLGKLGGPGNDFIRTVAVEVGGTPTENFDYALEGTPCKTALETGSCVEPRGVQEIFPRDEALRRRGYQGYVGKALRDSRGNPLGVVNVLFKEPLRDATLALNMLEIFGARAATEMERVRAEEERQLLENQLRQSQKMEAIGQLTGGIAHDFQNLLSVILLNTELMKDSLETGQPITLGEVREVEEAAQHAASMTKKLLGFGRRADLAMVPADLGKVVRGMSSMLRRVLPEHIEIRMEIQEPLDPVRADAGAVEQILLNLATNARDAMPSGGILTVEVRQGGAGGEGSPEVEGQGPADFLQILVSDNGCGMDPEVAARVFEPFFTTKPVGEGTGLGMAMVYGLTQQHGGFVRLDSEVGRGTTVELFFPLVPKTAAAAADGEDQLPAVGGTETLLLVEDQAALRRTLKLVLERAGYRVLMAEDGVEALELMRAHGGEVELILSDLVMPRMGGLELFRALEDEGRRVPFIMASGYAGKSAAGLAELDPSVPVLKKPWKPRELLHLIRTVLDR